MYVIHRTEGVPEKANFDIHPVNTHYYSLSPFWCICYKGSKHFSRSFWLSPVSLWLSSTGSWILDWTTGGSLLIVLLSVRWNRRQILNVWWEEGQKITLTVKYVSVTTELYLLQSLPLLINISEGCTGQDYTNRGCHICHSCFQKQLVVRGGAHVPFMHCNRMPAMN